MSNNISPTDSRLSPTIDNSLDLIHIYGNGDITFNFMEVIYLV